MIFVYNLILSNIIISFNNCESIKKGLLKSEPRGKVREICIGTVETENGNGVKILGKTILNISINICILNIYF